MKLVKEHINEKFTLDSDPIKDMGIGQRGILKKEHDILRNKNDVERSVYFFGNNNYLYVSGVLYAIIKNLLKEEFIEITAEYIYKILNETPSLSPLGKKVIKEYFQNKFYVKFDDDINEKFTEDSDPIHDMGIGIEKIINDYLIKTGVYTTNLNPLKNIEAGENLTKFIDICLRNKKYEFIRYVNNTANKDVKRYMSTVLGNKTFSGKFEEAKILVVNCGINLEKAIEIFRGDIHTPLTYKSLLQLKDMLSIKESLNEKFTQDSDPIYDMRIGMRAKIEEWLKKYEIRNYTINDDMTIDVNGKVDLTGKLNDNLPDYIQFYKISNGFFSVDHCNMTSLKGSPRSIDGNNLYHGNIQCKYNKLKSLKYAPKKISGYFMCGFNSRVFTEEEVKKVCKHIGKGIRV